MSWIFDHLNIVIVIALVIGSFLKSRFDSLNQEEQEPEEFPEFETYDEGQRQGPPPMPYVPPPIEQAPVPVERTPKQPRVFTTTRSQSGALTASADEAAAILKKQQDIQERLRAIREAHPAKSATLLPNRSRKSAPPAAVAKVPTSIRARLRNPAELRRAVILREILDKPVGLR